MNIALKWLAVAGSLVVLTGVADRMHFARGADEGPAPERRLEAGDTAGRLDRLIEMGVMYTWFHIYRPVGPDAKPALLTSARPTADTTSPTSSRMSGTDSPQNAPGTWL